MRQRLKHLSDNEKQALEALVCLLKGRYGSNLREIRLFGSKARGDSSKDSDLDLFLLFDADVDSSLEEEIYKLVSNIECNYDVLTSIIIYSLKKFGERETQVLPLIKNIYGEGISLMDEAYKSLANHRLQCAFDALAEAEALLNANKLKGSVNRIYYAAFYAIRSLLATRGFDSSKHRGVIAYFHKEFVKTGIIAGEFGGFIEELYKCRTEADYKDYVSFDEKDIKSQYQTCQRFLEHVKDTLERLKEI